MEQLRRNKPLAEEQTAIAAWNAKQQALLDQIWQGLRVAGNLHETYVYLNSKKAKSNWLVVILTLLSPLLPH